MNNKNNIIRYAGKFDKSLAQTPAKTVNILQKRFIDDILFDQCVYFRQPEIIRKQILDSEGIKIVINSTEADDIITNKLTREIKIVNSSIKSVQRNIGKLSNDNSKMIKLLHEKVAEQDKIIKMLVEKMNDDEEEEMPKLDEITELDDLNV